MEVKGELLLSLVSLASYLESTVVILAERNINANKNDPQQSYLIEFY